MSFDWFPVVFPISRTHQGNGSPAIIPSLAVADTLPHLAQTIENKQMTRFYGTRAWRALAAEAVRRQPVCSTPGCGKASSVADHILDRRAGGQDVQENLRALCPGCHNARRGRASARVRGCLPDGAPRDPGHWWRT
jgi:5-methylcytosine-specific restriction endonuclease McrA